MEMPEDEKVEVKPTWKLAWGLFWRMLLFYIPILVIGLILYATVWPPVLQKIILALFKLVS